MSHKNNSLPTTGTRFIIRRRQVYCLKIMLLMYAWIKFVHSIVMFFGKAIPLRFTQHFSQKQRTFCIFLGEKTKKIKPIEHEITAPAIQRSVQQTLPGETSFKIAILLHQAFKELKAPSWLKV